MRIDYLIRAHTAPEQVARLVERLDDGDVRFYVHVNRLSDDEVFEAMRARLAGREHVTWLPRVACRWGGFSLLEATLVGIEAILASGDLPDHALLLSGQDYPLKPPAEIRAHLAERQATQPAASLPPPRRRMGGRGRRAQPQSATGTSSGSATRRGCCGSRSPAASRPASSRTAGWRSGR